MSNSVDAYDPSGPSGHLPNYVGEEETFQFPISAW